MIGLDTNVLIRAFVIEDGEQTRRSRKLLDAQCSPSNPAYVNCVVLAETIWVLEARYGYKRDAIAAVVDQLLHIEDVILEHSNAVGMAMEQYLKYNVDFTDALVAQINDAAGCSATATFDRRAAKFGGFLAVP